MAETRLLTCFFCRGKKTICSRCRRYVAGDARCPEHDEPGVPCSNCEGKGFCKVPAQHVHECPDCYGYGYMCDQCGGAVPEGDICDMCGVEGSACTNCFGDGKVEITPA